MSCWKEVVLRLPCSPVPTKGLKRSAGRMLFAQQSSLKKSDCWLLYRSCVVEVLGAMGRLKP